MSTISDATLDGPAVYIPISQLELWPRNYRRGQVEGIAKSIAKFGFNQTLRVWRGRVMAGNHALKALRMLHEQGYQLPKGIIADPAGGWLAPCLTIDHLEETEAEAFAVADNALSDRSQNDDDMLLAVLSDLARLDADAMEAAGFSLGDLDEMAGAGDGQRISENPDSTVPLSMLKWGRTVVQITSEEEQALDKALEEYVEKHGTPFGFARVLVGL